MIAVLNSFDHPFDIVPNIIRFFLLEKPHKAWKYIYKFQLILCS